MTSVPILLYHSVCDDPPSWIAPYSVTRKAFARQLDIIAGSGRTPMTVTDFVAALRGQRAMPERPIVVTIDDGFADFAAAAECLAARELCSTLYVTTGALRGSGSQKGRMAIPPAPMLHWSQLPELERYGVEIGAHSHTHPQLDILPRQVAAEEIRRSKEILETALDHEIPSFAYPHGFHSARVRKVVMAAGYQSACAVGNMLSSISDDTYALSRLTVRSTTPEKDLSEWLEGRSAPVAPQPERLRTAAWRVYRRARGARSVRGVIAGADADQTQTWPEDND